MDNEVEMGGHGYLNQEIESDGDIDPNNDSEDNDGDEDSDGYDSQPDNSDDQSKGGDDQFDESGDDDDDGNDGDEDNDGYDSQPDDSDDQSEGGDDQFDESGDNDDDGNDDDRDDIKYMRGFGVIKFVDDKIYEQADPKLDLDNEDIEIDGDVYKLRGGIYGNGEHTLYAIKGMLFEECEDTGTDEDTGIDEDTGTDEVMNWDGKCFKRWKLGWEEKLEGERDRFMSDKKELQDNLDLANCKVCELILTHIKSLKGNYSEYIEHASDHDIDQIQKCCSVLMEGHCRCKGRGNEILAKMVRKHMRKIIDPDVSRDEKRKILSHQQKGSGIFSLLLGTVLPAIISAFVK